MGDRLQHDPAAFGAGRADPFATLGGRPHPDPGGTAGQLRWLLLADAERSIGRDGIHFGGHTFIAAGLNGRAGQRAQVRYTPHDMRQIEVFDGDTWLCTAYPQDALPESERDAVLARRRADAAELARRQRRASRRPGPRYGYRPMTVAPAVAAAPPATSAAAGPARVTVLSDPGDSPQAVAELAGRHDLDRGVAVCQPHPGATSPELLARDLLVALGKLTGALAAEHLSRRGWELAALWLAAEQVRHLIVLRADRLPAGCWSELAAAAGVRVWLLTAKMTPGQRAALEACATAGPAAHRPWHAALAELPAAGGSRTGGYGFPAVPDAEFPLFRATAARLLDPAAFAQVDTVYRDTYARACGHNAALRHVSGGPTVGPGRGMSHKSRSCQPHGAAGVPSASRPKRN